MKEELVSTIIGAAVIEFIYSFVLPKSRGAIAKYMRYLLSLVLVIAIVAPAVNIIKGNASSFKETLDKIKIHEASGFDYNYIYINNSIAYEVDENGFVSSDKPVVCDMYLLEVVRSIDAEINQRLKERFGVSADIGLSLDISDMESIKIISVHMSGVNGYLKSDIKSYLEKALGCIVYAE